MCTASGSAATAAAAAAAARRRCRRRSVVVVALRAVVERLLALQREAEQSGGHYGHGSHRGVDCAQQLRPHSEQHQLGGA